MLGLSSDFEAHVLIAAMSGEHASADHGRVYAAIEELDRSGHEKQRAIGLIFVVAPDNTPPDAHWRRRFAEQRKTFGSPNVFLSIVTQSAIIRGVLTAMNWIVPEPANMKSATHATFEQCAAWMERNQGTERSVLRTLMNEAARASTRTLAQKAIT